MFPPKTSVLPPKASVFPLNSWTFPNYSFEFLCNTGFHISNLETYTLSTDAVAILVKVNLGLTYNNVLGFVFIAKWSVSAEMLH